MNSFKSKRILSGVVCLVERYMEMKRPADAARWLELAALEIPESSKE